MNEANELAPFPLSKVQVRTTSGIRFGATAGARREGISSFYDNMEESMTTSLVAPVCEFPRCSSPIGSSIVCI